MPCSPVAGFVREMTEAKTVPFIRQALTDFPSYPRRRCMMDLRRLYTYSFFAGSLPFVMQYRTPARSCFLLVFDTQLLHAVK